MSFNEEWPKVSLDEICNITSSKRIYSSEYVDEGIPFYRSKEIIKKFKKEKIDEELNISEERFNEIKSKFGAPQKGDILLTSVGTIGIPYYVRNSDKFYFKDGNLTWFKNFNSSVISKYVYYWLQSKLGKQQINEIVIGSTQQALTIKSLKKMTLSLPKLKEQKRICDFLSKFDEKIEINNQMNETLEKMAQAIYKSWFVDFEPFQDCNFKKGSLKEIIDITLGNSPKSETYNEEGEGLPLLNGASDFVNGQPSCGRYSSKPKRVANKGEILLCTRGTIGNVTFSDRDYCIGRGVSSLDPKKETHKEYVYFTVKYYLEKLEQEAAGSVIRGLTKSDMLSIPIVMCEEKVMRNFHELVKPMINQQLFILKQNQTLKQLRDTLLPRLMSGEIRVPLEE